MTDAKGTEWIPGMKMTVVDGPKDMLTAQQRLELSDPRTQEEYRQAYRLQQARLSCPGCGETGFLG